MRFRTLLLPIACCAVVLIGVAGCGSSPGTRFYSLSSPQVPADASAMEGVGSLGIITVGPVELADYLDRSQIVRRIGTTRIELLEFDHWAGSLQNDLARVLVDNLKVQLLPAGYLVIPWEETALADGRIQVRVARFETTDRNTVVLAARWILLGKERGDIRFADDVLIKEQVRDSGVEAQVETMSRAMDELSRRIGERIEMEFGQHALNGN